MLTLPLITSKVAASKPQMGGKSYFRLLNLAPSGGNSLVNIIVTVGDVEPPTIFGHLVGGEPIVKPTCKGRFLFLKIAS